MFPRERPTQSLVQSNISGQSPFHINDSKKTLPTKLGTNQFLESNGPEPPLSIMKISTQEMATSAISIEGSHRKPSVPQDPDTSGVSFEMTNFKKHFAEIGTSVDPTQVTPFTLLKNIKETATDMRRDPIYYHDSKHSVDSSGSGSGLGKKRSSSNDPKRGFEGRDDSFLNIMNHATPKPFDYEMPQLKMERMKQSELYGQQSRPGHETPIQESISIQSPAKKTNSNKIPRNPLYVDTAKPQPKNPAQSAKPMANNPDSFNPDLTHLSSPSINPRMALRRADCHANPRDFNLDLLKNQTQRSEGLQSRYAVSEITPPKNFNRQSTDGQNYLIQTSNKVDGFTVFEDDDLENLELSPGGPPVYFQRVNLQKSLDLSLTPIKTVKTPQGPPIVTSDRHGNGSKNVDLENYRENILRELDGLFVKNELGFEDGNLGSLRVVNRMMRNLVHELDLVCKEIKGRGEGPGGLEVGSPQPGYVVNGKSVSFAEQETLKQAIVKLKDEIGEKELQARQ